MRPFAIGLIALLATACSSVTPNAGEEAVLIRKPIIFGAGGCDPTPVRTGRTYVALTTDHVVVAVTPQAFQQTFDDMNSKDGVPLDFNAQMTLQVVDSARMVCNFGSDLKQVYAANIAKEFESLTRKAVRNFAESAIAVSAIDEIDQSVEEGIRAHLKAINIPFTLREITVGKSNPPDAIEEQRVATAAQRQRQLTEAERDLAEQRRKAAEEARAQADNAYNQTMGLNPAQYVALEQIKMQREACAKGGCTFLLGGATATPLLSVR